MNPFNISFLIPGYLPAGRQVEPDAVEAGPGSLAAIRWESGLVQRPWQANFEQYLGLADATGLHLPMARLMCTEHSDRQGIVCADPIHLQADRDTAKLLPAEMLSLSVEEADHLISDINAFLRADNMVLTRRKVGQWCLSGTDASQLESYPPAFLANRNASAYLPGGENSGPWRRLMTELQMLLHAHPVNEQREHLGKLPINSLWFWGGASLYSTVGGAVEGIEHVGSNHGSGPESGPDSSGSTTFTVYADDEFTNAACADLQLPCKSLDEFDPLLCEESLVVDTRIANAIFARDEPQMHSVIERIDRAWLEPLSQRMNQGLVRQITLVNEDGDKGVLTRDLLQAHSRSDNRLLRLWEAVKLHSLPKRWFNAIKRS